MSQMFSEINKINNVLSPAAQSSGLAAAPGTTWTETDIVNMKLYKHCTFIMNIGATVADTVWNIKAMACPSATGTGVWTPINFNYRVQGSTETAAYASGSDIPGALTAGTTAGINTTTGYVGGVIIIEVDAPTVCAAGSSGGSDFDHVKLYIQSSTGGAYAPRNYSIVGILSEPRYPQAVLDTAID